MISKFFITATLGLASFASLAHAAPKPEVQAKEQFEDIQRLANLVNQEADPFSNIAKFFAASGEGKRDKLLAMRENMNQMGKEVMELESEKSALPSWEQQLTDKILPWVQENAHDVSLTIQSFDRNNQGWNEDESDYALLVADVSDHIKTAVGNELKLEKLEAREAALDSE